MNDLEYLEFLSTLDRYIGSDLLFLRGIPNGFDRGPCVKTMFGKQIAEVLELISDIRYERKEPDQWMSVRSHPPDPSIHQRILVFSEFNNIQIVHRDYDEWVLTECEYPSGNEFPGESVNFSHWMPLPKNPEQI